MTQVMKNVALPGLLMAAILLLPVPSFAANSTPPEAFCGAVCGILSAGFDYVQTARDLALLVIDDCPAQTINLQDAIYHLDVTLGAEYISEDEKACGDVAQNCSTFSWLINHALTHIDQARDVYLENACQNGCGEACMVRNVLLDARGRFLAAQSSLDACCGTSIW